jgi:hypothetical protein
MKPQDDIKILLEKHKAGTITDRERALLDKWYLHVAADDLEELTELGRLQTFDEVLTHLEKYVLPKSRVRRMWLRIAAAASILLIVSASSYYFLKKDQPPQIVIQKVHEVLPGGNKAYLVLGNGKRVSLTDAKNGMIASEGNKIIQKTADGKIVYEDMHSNHNLNANLYNTVETPRGGQYQIVLPDGSKVWLNSASSLKYPAVFIGSDRKVELTGEAYFEVAKDKAHPFIVKTGSHEVRVLGTHFNINAYPDESQVLTTLLEGAVQIKKNSEIATLKPGEQAAVQNEGSAIKISDADTEQAIAWKNGYFIFKDESVVSIMKQVSRWYDVDVEYSSDMRDRAFGGTISRYKEITELLNNMQDTKSLHYQIKGRKVIIMK